MQRASFRRGNFAWVPGQNLPPLAARHAECLPRERVTGDQAFLGSECISRLRRLRPQVFYIDRGCPVRNEPKLTLVERIYVAGRRDAKT